MADFEIIERLSDLEALSKDLLREKVVAVDTEADSFYHYFDKTCLVQIATRRHSYLIDPLALGGPAELAPLGPVLASKDVRVLFHAAEYDIFVLKRDCGFSFSNLFDTMISAQLLGYPAVGLSALIEHHFGIKLPKDEQRSDWSRRPLSDKQLKYAASDVQYLIRLAEKLERELRKAKRLGWAEAEFATLTQRAWPNRPFDKLGYLRIKGARGLDLKNLAVLRELYLMRDARAREIDRPPFKVLGNRSLLEIAEHHPRSLAALGEFTGISDLIVRRMGRDILAAIRRGRKEAHGPIPKVEGSGRRRMDRRTERQVARLKRWRSKRAHDLKIDPGVLCPNAALEAIAFAAPARGSDLTGLPELKTWFVDEFGDEVAEVLGRDEPEERTGSRETAEPRTRSPRRRQSSRGS